MLLFGPASSPLAGRVLSIDTIDALSIFQNTFKKHIFFAFIKTAFNLYNYFICKNSFL